VEASIGIEGSNKNRYRPSPKTYVRLKLLSTVLKRDIQDIIEKALQEYFERDDIRTALSTIFKTDSEPAGQG